MHPLFLNRAASCARFFAVALGFSIPISVALDNVLLVLILVSWLAAGGYREQFARVTQNPVAVAAFALFCLIGAGVTYSSAAPGDGLNMLAKYVDLAFVPIFVCLFRDERARRQAWLALAFALTLTLVLSYLRWLDLVPRNLDLVAGQRLLIDNSLLPDIYRGDVFKRYLTQSIFLAFGACLFANLAVRSGSAGGRWAWAILALLATFNVFAMSQGRSGQLILIALSVYAAFSIWRWRGALVAVAAAVILGASLMLGMTAAGDRATQALTELHNWQAERPADTSVGMRLEFYRNSLAIAREHPLLGAGTGSFSRIYADHVTGTAAVATVNPHNEYLNIAIQLGAVGVLALLYLFFCEWRLAPRLPATLERHLARGLVITFVVGCMFNSLLMDHAEGLFFAWVTGLLFAGLRPQREPGALSS